MESDINDQMIKITMPRMCEKWLEYGCTLTDRKLDVLFIIYRRTVKTGVGYFPIQSSTEAWG